ncbi:sigma-54-dependent Fis family transcriptional regulator [Methylococcus capsulatus]|uniref:sigma-54-dependent Fis family transcriptional regulator n=1 Tax=Methylococcus capsulatus TaxID=414 RepID=UPI001C52C2A0|nr:sigma 54-interacting transcriptional regulator [Methylococcus capsulatus]QXP88068.1 sigma 54-interacting transcriptional regulator [Methylococcus capsulatus]QXP94920.1 sigma 54-interacting transcriptional regulator [Methylococcus capsulatus]UQN13096.1 sigma 54-interacting transcriptional regulator [Methylococcus capsulatus]
MLSEQYLSPVSRPVEFPDWNRFSSVYVDRPDQAWEWMRQTGVLPAALDWVRPEVAEAWCRCFEDYRLPPGTDDWPRKAGPDGLEPCISLELASVWERVRGIFDFLKGAQAALIVADARCRIFRVLDDGLRMAPVIRELLRTGADWREEVLGNNGIGSAAVLGTAIAFEGKEHYGARLHALVTAGCPLRNAAGETTALVGLVSDRRGSAGALLAFLRMACDGLAAPGPERNRRAEQVTEVPPGEHGLIRDAAVEGLLDKALRLQERGIPLLVSGESGTGKEYLVRFAHRLGPRRKGPLVAVNCASIPKDLIESELFGYEAGSFTGARSRGKPGKFLLADGGVLFLDEIGDMSFDLQATLLRVLETGEFVPVGGAKPLRVDVQVVAATNVDLQEAIRQGRFRRDLYYRLNGARLHLPPLRQRPDRCRIFHAVFEQEAAAAGASRIRLGEGVMALFERHPWPGNLRELRNVIRNALFACSGSVLTVDDLPADFLEEAEQYEGSSGLEGREAVHFADGLSLSKVESESIAAAICSCRGNMSQAARVLGIARSTLYKKVSRYGLSTWDSARALPKSRVCGPGSAAD